MIYKKEHISECVKFATFQGYSSPKNLTSDKHFYIQQNDNNTSFRILEICSHKNFSYKNFTRYISNNQFITGSLCSILCVHGSSSKQLCKLRPTAQTRVALKCQFCVTCSQFPNNSCFSTRKAELLDFINNTSGLLCRQLFLSNKVPRLLTKRR